MPAAAIQLPPKGTPVLVCEGESDLRFLVGQADYNSEGIFTRFAPHVWVYQALGGNRAKALVSFFPPEPYPSAAYICDRDFQVTHADALLTLQNRERKTYWARHDIESYLLYPDWLMAAFKVIQASPKFHGHPIPTNETELHHSLLDIAARLAIYHAGNQTMQDLMLNIKSQIQDQGIKQYNTVAEWENYLRIEANRYQAMGEVLATSTKLHEEAVLTQFTTNIRQYQTWATLSDTIQIHFSGKRMFVELASQWQVNVKGAKYSWETLRNLTIIEAVSYSQQIIGFLSDDPRLGDFGLLASKILGRKI